MKEKIALKILSLLGASMVPDLVMAIDKASVENLNPEAVMEDGLSIEKLIAQVRPDTYLPKGFRTKIL